MGSPDDPRAREVIAALRRPADVPLGMNARLEASVLRRTWAPARLTAAEKWAFGSVVALPFLAGGGGAAVLLLAALGVAGYVHWTVLVDVEGSESA